MEEEGTLFDVYASFFFFPSSSTMLSSLLRKGQRLKTICICTAFLFLSAFIPLFFFLFFFLGVMTANAKYTTILFLLFQVTLTTRSRKQAAVLILDSPYGVQVYASICTHSLNRGVCCYVLVLVRAAQDNPL